MKNVVDSSGWVEYFQNGSNAAYFVNAIEDEENLLVPSICVYEVFKRMLAIVGEDEAYDAIGFMLTSEVVDLDRDIAIAAVYLSTELKLAMADSIILATARSQNAILWTQDEHFKDLPDVRYSIKK